MHVLAVIRERVEACRQQEASNRAEAEQADSSLVGDRFRVVHTVRSLGEPVEHVGEQSSSKKVGPDVGWRSGQLPGLAEAAVYILVSLWHSKMLVKDFK